MKNTHKNLSGHKINNYHLIEFTHQRKGRFYYNCVCDCGIKYNKSVDSVNQSKNLRCYKCPKETNKKLVGTKINSWTIVSMISNCKIDVKCECGFEKTSYIRTIENSECCRKCNARKKRSKDSNKNYVYNEARKGALKRNMVFEVEKEFIFDLLAKQENKCALSGVPIYLREFNKKCITDNNEQTASLDRIDSTKGYTKDNVQWIHKIVNKIKGNMPEDRLIYLCHKITEFNNLV